VLSVGVTTRVPALPTLPTPGLMVTMSAFAVFQVIVALSPDMMVMGEIVQAVN
jgi:hypothetical protein